MQDLNKGPKSLFSHAENIFLNMLMIKHKPLSLDPSSCTWPATLNGPQFGNIRGVMASSHRWNPSETPLKGSPPETLLPTLPSPPLLCAHCPYS